MIESKVSHSEDPDAEDAIEEIIEDCREYFGSKIPQAGIISLPTNIDHQLILNSINEAFPDIELIGCTNYCQASSTEGFIADSVLLCLFYSEDVKITAGVGKDLSKNAQAATQAAVDQALAKTDLPPAVCIVTPESLTIASEYIVDGLSQALGNNFPIVGGTASDPIEFTDTKQFYKTEVLQDSVPILIFSGPVKYSIGISSGWVPVGDKFEVTKSNDNILYNIGEQTAVEFYTKNLGKEQISPEYPLAIFDDQKSEHYVLRAPLKLGDESGTIHFAGLVQEGKFLSMTRASRDNIVLGTIESLTNAQNNFDGDCSCALMFSCCGREMVLGSRIAEEIGHMKSSLPPNTTIAGYYSFGEFGPLQLNGQAKFHNETVVTLLLG